MRFVFLLTLVVTSVVSLAGRALADGTWAASFPGPAAGSHLPAGQPAVLIAAAGVDPEAASAAAALITALRASGRASLVMDAAGLGEVRGLDDPSLVKRAAGLPVKVVLVIRTFPGASGPTAVATLYDRGGKTLGAFSVTRGAPLSARTRDAGAGVSGEASAAVSAVLKDSGQTDPQRKAKESEYQRRHVGFNRFAVFHVYSGVLSGHWGAPYLGSDANPLEPQRFFEAVGRPDHARYYQKRRVAKRALQIPGWLAMLGGATMATIGGLGHPKGICRGQSLSGECIDHAPGGAPALLWTGVSLSTLGLAAVIVAAAINPFPTSAEQTYQLAATHNQRLRESLGLPHRVDDDVPPQYQRSARGPARSVRVTPVAGAGGGGLTLQGTF